MINPKMANLKKDTNYITRFSMDKNHITAIEIFIDKLLSAVDQTELPFELKNAKNARIIGMKLLKLLNEYKEKIKD